jgi:predicted nucleotidyltransferase
MVTFSQHFRVLLEKNKSLLTFDEIKELVLSLCKDNDHILSAYLFGSYSRGEATGESDIDVHIVSDGTMSLVDLIDFENRLSRLSGKKVDAVGSTANSPETDFVHKPRLALSPSRCPLGGKQD